MATGPENVMETKPEPTRLCRFLGPSTPPETIERTANYAKDPRGYLERVLGRATMEQREHLLCIPEKVSRDMYGNGEHKQQFEKQMARLLGKDHGLFFITGVQAQLIALKVHCSRAGNSRLAWHVSSHLESAEEGAYKELYGLERTLIGAGKYDLPTIDQTKQVLSLPAEQRPAAILIELPSRETGCQTYTFAEMEEISRACKEAGVKLHLDGARLWEIEPYYQATAGKTFSDVCALFDTVYVSFYKGLEGVAGAILACNDESLIKEAKMWQRRVGGNVITLHYEVIDCERAYNEQIGTFAQKRDKMIEIVDGITAATQKFKTRDGEPVVQFLPERPTCSNIRTIYRGVTLADLHSARDTVQEKTNVRIFERCWPKKTLDEQLEAERAGKKDGPNGQTTAEDAEDNCRHMTEWGVMSTVFAIDSKIFVDSYVALCEEILRLEKSDDK